MNSELKAFIYEAYNRGDIDGESVKDIIGDVDDCDITEAAYLAADAEITEAENIFIETAMDYAVGNVNVAIFEKKAEGIGIKIKAAWEKFKKWVKATLDKFKKKLFDATDTFYVDKSKWTLMQKIDSALQKAYNNLLPIANQQREDSIDVDVQFGKKISDCFVDLVKLTAEAAPRVVAGAVMLKVAHTAIRKVIEHTGDLTSKIVEIGDKSNSTMIKNIMKVIRPVLNRITEIGNSIRAMDRATTWYKANRHYSDKKDADDALRANGFDETKENRTELKITKATTIGPSKIGI